MYEFLERSEAANARGHRDCHPIGVDTERAGLLQGLVGGDERKLGESIETAVLALWKPWLGVPVGDQMRPRGRWRALHALPQIIHADTWCSHDTDPGNDNLP